MVSLRPSARSCWSLMTAYIPCVLLLFTSSFLLVLFSTQRTGMNWKEFLTRSNSSKNLPSPSISSTRNDPQRPSVGPARGDKQPLLAINPRRTHHVDYSKSELFQKFVEIEHGNFSSVAEYLRSANNDLLTFRSPMIRENPSEYSWPETETEQKERNWSPTTKQIVWYYPPSYIVDNLRQKPWGRFRHCPLKDCVVSIDYKRDHAKADAIVFRGGPAKVSVLPRDHADQIYVFHTMESPSFTDSGYGGTAWNTAFNWTWNFRIDSDIYSPVGYLKRSASVPSHSTLLALRRQKKKSVAWMASNCQVQSRRDQYVHRLRKVIPVDVYGRCGNLSCPRLIRQCDLLLNDYLFYLAFENSMCVDYVTEKLYKTFSQGVHVIPVVRGGANYSRFFPAGTFIDAEAFPSSEELGRYLLELAHDEARYVDMLWKRAHFVYHEHGIVDAFCQLCYKLHHLDRFKKTYSDMYGWYHRHGCSGPKPF
ncbi:hypothetical protein ACOMHN_033286 [Nucella lapillus]